MHYNSEMVCSMCILLLTSYSPVDVYVLFLAACEVPQEPTLMICKDMFKAGSDIQSFIGLKIQHESSGLEGGDVYFYSLSK